MEITKDILRECIYYNPESGVFTWLHRDLKYFNRKRDQNAFNSRFAYTIAGNVKSGGYLGIQLFNKTYWAHRLAWLYCYGEWPKNQIDIIDGNKLNIRINNLREATAKQNMQNIHSMKRRSNANSLIGACWDKKAERYRTQIMTNGKSKYLGHFDTAIEAHNAYIEAKRKYHKFNTL